MQVTNPGDQFEKSASGLMTNIETNASFMINKPGSLWRHLVGKFATNAIGAIWWANLEPMQVAPSGGQLCN